MATYRPIVSIYKADNPAEKKETMMMPAVMATPLRPDLVRYIHTNMAKNKRQAHAVKPKAGYGYAAESWGTGRAVARIPRVPGGGTHRAGQGAFGNMCRGGGRFAPTKTWRRWHRKLNKTSRRHAVCSALAASSLPPLVMARGHLINEVAELPLVVSEGVESLQKTKAAIAFFKKVGCEPELNKLLRTRKVRTGKARQRIGKYKVHRGPLVIYHTDSGIVNAMRNIPGVETMHVERLNLLTLAPGGTFGRFIIWTEGAFKRLEEIYGNGKNVCPEKKDYWLPRPNMTNADVTRIINSDEVQSALRPMLETPKTYGKKKNPYKDKKLMEKLHPGITQKRMMRKRAMEAGTSEHILVQKAKTARLAARKEYNAKHKRGKDTFFKKLMRAFEPKKEEAHEDE